MAKTTLNNIKNWFLTGLKPTQAQFWNAWDSFWHKDDAIPIASVDGLQDILDAKSDTGAIPLTFKKIAGIWFDTEGNTDVNVPEVGNPFLCWYNGEFIAGTVASLPFDIDNETTYNQNIRS